MNPPLLLPLRLLAVLTLSIWGFPVLFPSPHLPPASYARLAIQLRTIVVSIMTAVWRLLAAQTVYVVICIHLNLASPVNAILVYFLTEQPVLILTAALTTLVEARVTTPLNALM